MNSRDFAITITLLDGKARALHEQADKLPLKQAAQDFLAARDLFERLLLILRENPDHPVEQHRSSLVEISYRLAAASYILAGRAKRRDVINKQIQAICRAIDTITLFIWRVEVVGRMFDFFVRVRMITEEAKAVAQLPDVLPPRVSFEQAGAGRRLGDASAAVRVRAVPSKAPPQVQERHRVERVGNRSQKSTSKTPPAVLPKYRVEHVGTAKPPRRKQ